VAEGTGSPEVVGEAGLVVARESPVELAGAIEKLWADRATLRRLSKKAHDRIREFSLEKVAESRSDFYVRVMERGGKRAIAHRQERLSSLPPQCAGALLPSLAQITSSLCGLHGTTQTPGRRLLKLMNEIESESGSPAQVLLYGAGKHTARLLAERNVWESKKHKVVGIIDDHPRFGQMPVYLDLPVQSLESAKARVVSGKMLPPVVLSTDTYEEQFWEQSAPLREAGVLVFRLYS
jgi:hypothetical protein